jgi:hypothetical protein
VRRVLVVGMSGAGKTTVARRLGVALGAPFHEMDVLALGPGFSTRPELVDDVHRVTGDDAWVIDSWGNPEVRDRLWARADTVIWLDYPFALVLARLVRRSVRRTLTRERVFGGNRETLAGWFRRDHPVVPAVTTFGERRRYLARRTAASAHLTTLRFTDPREAERWLRRVETSP